MGVDLRQGDLTRTAAIVDAMRGTEAAIHIAGMYRLGIPASERAAMHDANVGAVHRVLDAFATAGLDQVGRDLDDQRRREHARPDRR